jgi:hypothetical protein
MNEKGFKHIFVEALSTRGFSTERLSELSGVPERYIEALRAGNYESLPSAPYVRGYIFKIATLMGVSGDEWWRAYREEHAPRGAGAEDRLPSNRFTLKRHITTGRVALLVVVVLTLGYGAVRFNAIFGVPKLEITNPSTASIVVTMDRYRVTGKVSAGDSLTVNGESEMIKSDGSFEKELQLYPGVNTFEFKVSHFLGRDAEETRKIVYQPNIQDTPRPGEPPPERLFPTSSPTSTMPIEETSSEPESSEGI